MVTAAVSRALGALLEFLGSIPAIGWLVIALVCWGAWGHHQQAVTLAEKQAATLAAARAATNASEKARATEQQLNNRVQEISDELTQAQTQRDAAARDAARRLRDLAAAKRTGSATAATCASYEGPAVAVVPDQAREALIDLARDADEVTGQLVACQAYVRNVVQLGAAQPRPAVR